MAYAGLCDGVSTRCLCLYSARLHAPAAPPIIRVLDHLHEHHVYGRRVRVLVEQLAALVPRNARVLDVGCGDGAIDAKLARLRSDLHIEGIDVLARPSTHVPVTRFDGVRLPFPDQSYDVVTFIDVLHHTHDPAVLLAEARRVARRAVVLKDHCRDGLLAGPTLRFMDFVGNARYGIALPYNYWPEARWRETFDRLGLRVDAWCARLGLYPWPASMVFERRLHFVTRLVPTGAR